MRDCKILLMCPINFETLCTFLNKCLKTSLLLASDLHKINNKRQKMMSSQILKVPYYAK